MGFLNVEVKSMAAAVTDRASGLLARTQQPASAWPGLNLPARLAQIDLSLDVDQ